MNKERKQFYFDVFVTACEGGINYWARVRKYHWMNRDENTGKHISDDIDGFYAVVEDAEAYGEVEDACFPKSKIDKEIIRKGVCRIINGCVKREDGTHERLRIAEDIRSRICEASAQNDAGMLDAEDADCIVQVGLLGEIMFG